MYEQIHTAGTPHVQDEIRQSTRSIPTKARDYEWVYTNSNCILSSIINCVIQ